MLRLILEASSVSELLGLFDLSSASRGCCSSLPQHPSFSTLGIIIIKKNGESEVKSGSSTGDISRKYVASNAFRWKRPLLKRDTPADWNACCEPATRSFDSPWAGRVGGLCCRPRRCGPPPPHSSFGSCLSSTEGRGTNPPRSGLKDKHKKVMDDDQEHLLSSMIVIWTVQCLYTDETDKTAKVLVYLQEYELIQTIL